MKEAQHYNKQFFDELEAGSYASARIILPIINQLLQPKSVVDVGCGSGGWLRVWDEDLHLNDLVGIEGDYVTPDIFKANKSFLKNYDLKKSFDLKRKFDLVTTMEVAEHLPEENADIFIENLVSLSDVILFSAAIISQRGTFHINEQMPEYWANKFLKHEYIAVDYLRPIIWNDKNIQYWYRQNSLLFIKKSKLDTFSSLQKVVDNTDIKYLTRIHPENYFAHANQLEKLQTLNGFIKFKLYEFKKWLKI